VQVSSIPYLSLYENLMESSERKMNGHKEV